MRAAVARAFGAARIGIGVAMLVDPALPARLTATAPTPRIRAITRVLGLRYAGQGALGVAVPHEPGIDAGVEVLHTATMLPVVVLHPRAARLALLSALVATGLAVGEMSAR